MARKGRYMIKIKIETFNEKDERVDDYDYEPESTIKEAINISEALKPLRFKVRGFIKNGSYDFTLHLSFVRRFLNEMSFNRQIPCDTFDDFGDAADSHKGIVINGSHDKPDGTV
jgi:hypothetical protein